MSDLTDNPIPAQKGEIPTTGKPKLSGSMGTIALMLTVLAFSAPMAVVEGFIPYTIYFGGPGATFAFALTTVVLLLFAVGYIAMTRHIPKPGNFYAFISAGLGRATGLGSAFLATTGYICILGGNHVYFGVATSELITSFGGPHTPWLLWSFIGWATVTILGHFHIELSARILMIAMTIEVLVVLIFNAFVIGQGGAEGLSAEPLTLHAFTQGNIAVTLVFTILVFLGFEATALFRDEVRNPNHTVPRATYSAIVFIGILYVLACYAMTMAYGSQAWEVAKENPIKMFPQAIGLFVHPAFEQLVFFSVIISIFAANLSIHNVSSRYIMNLAADRALPEILAAVHIRHISPYMGSAAAGIFALALVLISYLSKIDATAYYAIIMGIGAIAIIFTMGLVSFAVAGWFAKHGIPADTNILKVYIAPIIAGTVLIGTMIYTCLHLDILVGGEPGENNWINFVLLGVFLLGMGIATWFRHKHPQIYGNLGRAG